MELCPNNILAARIKSGMSQKEVALSLHVAAPTVSDWERQKKYPSIENLKALSSLLGVSIDYLLGHTGKENGRLPHSMEPNCFNDFSILIQNLGYSTRYVGTDELRFEIKKDGTNTWFSISEEHINSIIRACLSLMAAIFESTVQTIQSQVKDEDHMVPQDIPEIKAAMDELGRQLLLEKKAADESGASTREGSA